MYRFYAAQKNIFEDKIIIDDLKEIHHIKDVLRIKEKDSISIFDDKGNTYIGFIKELNQKNIVIAIKEKPLSPVAGINITVACALPKKSRMDDIVDKLTQLGADRIIPLQTQRVIIKLDKPKKTSRHLRWVKIALGASQQSQRNSVPVVEPIRPLKEVLAQSQDYDLKLIPTLIDKPEKTLKEILAGSKPKNIIVLIGPEGDFSPGEVDLAKQAGFIPVSLGNSILRVETAAVAVVSFIRLYENG